MSINGSESIKKNAVPLPSPKEVKTALPLQTHQREWVEECRRQIINILEKKDPRKLLVVGPCSIHDIAATQEYAENLKQLSKKVEDSFFIVMRIYCEKARTTIGWKGFMYDPHLDETHDMHSGIKQTRELMLMLANMQVPIATEFLEPLASLYHQDLVSWGSIGARTSSSQVHRQLASGFDFPVAFKNSTDGNIDSAIQGMIASSTAHQFIGINEQGILSAVTTQGNAHTHLVLRGSDLGTNYSEEAVCHAQKKLLQAELPSRIMIDCSHGNSRKQHQNQPHVLLETIGESMKSDSAIIGMMLESHLYKGTQPPGSLPRKYGVSITDPCMDWKTTENLILHSAEELVKFLI